MMPEKDGRALRICLLSYRSNPHSGGQGVYLRNISRALKDLGHHVDVVSGPPDPMLDADIPLFRLPSLDLYNPNDLFRVPRLKELAHPVNLIEWLGVSTMGFPEPFTFGLRAYGFLRKKCLRKKFLRKKFLRKEFLRKEMQAYDIVHDNQSLSYGIWAIGRKIPVIATIHHPITVDRDLAVRAASGYGKKIEHLRWHSFLRMQKRVASGLPQVITVSKSARDDIAREFSIPRDRFSIILNGIDVGLFRPLPEIRREQGRVIVTNSADIPLKGLNYLLRATALIARKRPVRLIVIGSPKKNGVIEKLVGELGIGDSVTFTGRIGNDEFVRQYAKASVAVIPSVYEGFGLPAGEAMACGVPVVSTTGGALPEVVGKTGILVPPADHDALAMAISHLLDNPALADEMGRAGLKRVRRMFTWERAAERTVAAYRRAIWNFKNKKQKSQNTNDK